MSTKAPKNTSRIELWIPKNDAEYLSQLSAHKKSRRKLWLEAVISNHVSEMKKTFPGTVRQEIKSLRKRAVKKSQLKKKK